MKVLIACGGTGGHIFPAVALSQTLQKFDKDIKLLFVTTQDPARFKKIYKIDLPVKRVSALGLPDKINIKTALFFICLLVGIIRSLFILIIDKPDVVIGFGGYAASPVVLAAFALRIPIILHEQNAAPGRANLKLAGLATKVAISWPVSKNYFDGKISSKIVVTGNPLRAELIKIDKLQARLQLSIKPDKFTILVMGGSQGAHKINDILCQTLSLMTRQEQLILQVIHLTGAADYNHIRTEYGRLNVDNKVFEFFDDMGTTYSASDMVVSRAGASAISEIAFFGIPAILIPYRYRAAHQRENARLLEGDGAIIMEEDKLTASELKVYILNIINDTVKLKKMSDALQKVCVDSAADKLAHCVLDMKDCHVIG